MSDQLTINFDVNGSVSQNIKIDPSAKISAEQLLGYFESGEAVTSIGHGSDLGCVYLIKDGQLKLVGKVVYQEALDNTTIEMSEEVDFEEENFED